MSAIDRAIGRVAIRTWEALRDGCTYATDFHEIEFQLSLEGLEDPDAWVSCVYNELERVFGVVVG